ncbi:MAG TPA: acetylornithine/succinylornithine family transaminase [Clostridiales bacterium]|nr:acetylornithine/succinylornithine family transaminase [Clostridiales bacterium]
MDIFELDKKYIAGTYNRFPVNLIYGLGSLVFDEMDRRYIDLTSGIGVTAFGHSDEEWTKAVITQINKLAHVSNLYYTNPDVKLAELLCKKTGMNKVFFSNSGAEANECAIKAARKYSAKKGEDCYTIMTLENSFHGRTLTTLAATGQEHYHELYTPLTPGFVYAETNMESVKSLAETTKIAGIMIECIQGEGGVNVLPADFVRELAEYTKENDIPLIIDEVQTGNGRTGQLYAYMNYKISPDIVTTAKGLGGGLPIGACLLSEKFADVFGYGDHGSTFGGNPIACAGAFSIISRLDDDFLADVKRKGVLVKSLLDGAKGVESVCGMGLMIGIKTTKPAGEVVKKCIEKGVLVLTAKDKVRLLPPLNINDDMLIEAINIIKEVCRE